MISVDFDKLSQLCTFISTAAAGVENTINKLKRERDNFIFTPQEASSIMGITRAEKSMVAAIKAGDKIVCHCEELISFIRDEMARYEAVENQLVQLANAIKFEASPRAGVDYILQKTSMGIECGAASITELSPELEQSLETDGDDESDDDETFLDNVASWGEEEKDKLFTEAKEDAKYLKNKAEDGMEKLEAEGNWIEGKLADEEKALKTKVNNIKNKIEEVQRLLVKIAEDLSKDTDTSNIDKFLNTSEETALNKAHSRLNDKKGVWSNFKKNNSFIASKIEEECDSKIAEEQGKQDIAMGLVETPLQLPHLAFERETELFRNPVGVMKHIVNDGISPSDFIMGITPQEKLKFLNNSAEGVINTGKQFWNANPHNKERMSIDIMGNAALFFGGLGEAKSAIEAEKVGSEAGVIKAAKGEEFKVPKFETPGDIFKEIKKVFGYNEEENFLSKTMKLSSKLTESPMVKTFPKGLKNGMSEIKAEISDSNIVRKVEEKPVIKAVQETKNVPKEINGKVKNDIINRKSEASSEVAKVKSVKNKASEGVKTTVNKSDGGKGNTTGAAEAIERAIAKGTPKTWEEFLAVNSERSVEEVSSSYIKLIEGQSPWPENFVPQQKILKPGDTFQMALDSTQPVTSPGGFATFDNIPNVDYVRNNLAVKSDWKVDCSKVVTYRVKQGVDLHVLEGPVGPQIDINADKYLPGGGTQIQMLLDRSVNKMDYLEVVSIRSIN
ncbi:MULTISPECIES: hypothetical protein [Clostridium]|uniref:hypothetical protein n=2 Tax=Clostridium TaxID=1485 RepID=UPI000825D8AE|nr:MULTISPECIES: hypothetical protein [Clostridium]PJI07819.1 hypothetical protein CUB90_08065 [Clostridium sp. CT7]